MSPWQSFYEQVSGTVWGGVGLYAVILVALWMIWTFAFIFSRVIPKMAFFKWGLLFTFSFIMFFVVMRVRHPAPIVPDRLWVQPFACEYLLEDDADCARYAFERALEEAHEQTVAFQTKGMGEKYLEREIPATDSDPSAGALLTAARYGATGKYSSDGTNSTLEMKVHEFNWKGETENLGNIIVEGISPADAGRKAAIKFIQVFNLKQSIHSDMFSYSPEILTALYRAESSSSFEVKEEALLDGFISPDSAQPMIWEALADMYFRWSFGNHQSRIEHSIQRSIEFDDRASRAYYIHGKVLQRTAQRRQEAIAAWKLAYIYNKRDQDPLLSLAALQPKEIRDLRMGSKKMLLTHILRLRPANPKARRALFTYYRDWMRQAHGAMEILNQGIALNPDETQLLMSRAVYAIKMGNLGEAEGDLIHILQNNPLNPNAWYNLGIIYRSQKKDTDARDAFERSLHLDGPIDSHYYLGLYYLYVEENEEKALFHFRWRWVKRKSDFDDFFAMASQERIRLIRTGHSFRTGVKLPGWHGITTQEGEADILSDEELEAGALVEPEEAE